MVAGVRNGGDQPALPRGNPGATPPMELDATTLIAFATLIGMEVVLGIDNLVFIAILTNRLPQERRRLARRVGLGLAVILRFAMLAGATWLLSLTRPLIELGPIALSGKDLILLGGGLFLIGKATLEIHHRVDPDAQGDTKAANATPAGFWPVVLQILLLDAVFSVDSVIVAVGLVRDFWLIAAAITVSVAVMAVSMDKLADFLERNPTLVMLALAFLVMIGMVLVADGFEVHVPKGFVYTAMAFATGVELLNVFARRAARRRRAASGAAPGAVPGTPSTSGAGAE